MIPSCLGLSEMAPKNWRLYDYDDNDDDYDDDYDYDYADYDFMTNAITIQARVAKAVARVKFDDPAKSNQALRFNL